MALQAAKAHADTSKPNIVLIITDDQDSRYNSIDYMPKLQSYLADKGTNFDKFYAPMSLCCPSRVSLLRAQHSHNHNVTYTGLPWGGYVVFCEKGYNGYSLPSFLQAAGYSTYYTGKLMNGHQTDNAVELPVQGFNDSEWFLDPWTYDYLNVSVSINNEEPFWLNGVYSQYAIVNRTKLHLDEIATNPDTPFFLAMAPVAPHANILGNVGATTPPIPEDKYANNFTDVTVPRFANWNFQGGASWVRELPSINDTVAAYIDEWYRARLRALLSVDDMIESVINRLDEIGVLNNTYVFYVADNGYALGAHRLNPSKTLPYEEDVRVPFLVRGPGVPEGRNNTEDLYSMVDLGATILNLTGATPDYDIDGMRIPITLDDLSNTPVGQKISLSEYWVYGKQEGTYGGASKVSEQRVNTTYRTLRVITGDHFWAYNVWCTGEHELYDMQVDPYQIDNLADINATTFEAAFASSNLTLTATRLDALMLVLKTCVSTACTDPWSELLPSTGVTSLDDALSSTYDDYFSSVPKVTYSKVMSATVPNHPSVVKYFAV
ncbi:sulfatase [Fistulina hepatica ATCC 64428]|uniref:Sulfatase n=1 Tax=Fistulina hepatica ATCC 64428 TaxID=1128425 RepID=A0A0D7A751_9AGAR|nr:sulfatase [Fistulina hepatica ATCC 64428]